MIRLENIKRRYHQGEHVVYALDGVSLAIDAGSFVTMLGPSGSGKTTLLNMLGGLDQPTEGEVFLDEQPLSQLSSKALTEFRKANIGFIFQHYHLLPTLTVYENVALGYRLNPGNTSIEAMLEAVGLHQHAHKFPHQLSGGEKQRVAIARALIKEPKVLLCDEPTGALDETTGKAILALLSDLNQRLKTTLILITHHRGIAKISDRIVTLNSGIVKSDEANAQKLDANAIVWS